MKENGFKRGDLMFPCLVLCKNCRGKNANEAFKTGSGAVII